MTELPIVSAIFLDLRGADVGRVADRRGAAWAAIGAAAPATPAGAVNIVRTSAGSRIGRDRVSYDALLDLRIRLHGIERRGGKCRAPCGTISGLCPDLCPNFFLTPIPDILWY